MDEFCVLLPSEVLKNYLLDPSDEDRLEELAQNMLRNICANWESISKGIPYRVPIEIIKKFLRTLPSEIAQVTEEEIKRYQSMYRFCQIDAITSYEKIGLSVLIPLLPNGEVNPEGAFSYGMFNKTEHIDF